MKRYQEFVIELAALVIIGAIVFLLLRLLPIPEAWMLFVVYMLLLAAGFILYQLEVVRKKVGAPNLIMLMLLCLSIAINITLVMSHNAFPWTSVRPIESLPMKVHQYEGEDDASIGSGTSMLEVEYGEDSAAVYRLFYSLPEAQKDYGYAGLAFEFDTPQDLTGYEYIKMTMSFKDDAQCNLYIEDGQTSDKQEYVRLGNSIVYDNDIRVESGEGTQTLWIPLMTKFGAVDLQHVARLNFGVDTYFARGYSQFTASRIELVKK
jgi:hypothetical protein